MKIFIRNNKERQENDKVDTKTDDIIQEQENGGGHLVGSWL